jgi:hypothetical protein
MAFPGIATSSLSSLCFFRKPLLHSARFTPSSLVKTWVRELKAFKDQGQLGFDNKADTDANIASETNDPEAALVPVLGYLTYLSKICKL